jgi:S-adenosylmethionine hydrolase
VGPFFLLSDFGDGDCYAAQMKAALMDLCGGCAAMVDLTHRVAPGSVREGAFHLMTSVPRIPAGSVVLAVVDPGVGTERRGLACLAGGRIVVGPDNGLLSWLEPDDLRLLPPPGPGVSGTFHGRDWFAPMAARLALNPQWLRNLEPCSHPVLLPKGAVRRTGGAAEVPVAHVDRFGNCILWLRPGEMEGFRPAFVRTGLGRFPLARTSCYASESGGLLLLEGSQGFMELAVGSDRADVLLGLSPDGVAVLEE